MSKIPLGQRGISSSPALLLPSLDDEPVHFAVILGKFKNRHGLLQIDVLTSHQDDQQPCHLIRLSAALYGLPISRFTVPDPQLKGFPQPVVHVGIAGQKLR